MERVLGIGGVFFRARDPEVLQAWYTENLGVPQMFEAERGDLTVWSAFNADTGYFGRLDQQSMLNYRVSDLDAMLVQLRAAGAVVDDKVEQHDYGRFGWATDPEGNRFELWEPRPA
ncbi:MAG: VOC family protein [Actinobacteria bacterium]|nr:VOC family protein [Actinomycetota bacterium]